MKIKQFTSSHKILSIFSGLSLLAIMIVLWLHFPILVNAGSSNGYSCSRMHIYIPRRLDFKGCKTVTGTIMQYKVEPDGDTHALLQLDNQFKSLLTQQNYNKQQGDLVIEDTCHAQPKDFLVHFVCLNYKSPLPDPTVGKRYEITGNYVIDDWHGSWAEIHGVAELRQLP